MVEIKSVLLPVPSACVCVCVLEREQEGEREGFMLCISICTYLIRWILEEIFVLIARWSSSFSQTTKAHMMMHRNN